MFRPPIVMALYSSRKQRSNKLQIDYLWTYMQEHGDFAKEGSKTPQGAARIERQWTELQAALNGLGSPRTVDQWKIVSSLNIHIIILYLGFCIFSVTLVIIVLYRYLVCCLSFQLGIKTCSILSLNLRKTSEVQLKS